MIRDLVQISIVSAAVIWSANGSYSIFAQEENVTPKDDLSLWSDAISPIVVAFIAVVGGYYAGTKITQRWKEREKLFDLELKEREFESNLISDINDCVMRIIVAIMRVEEYLSITHSSQDKINENQNKESSIPAGLTESAAKEYGDFLIRGHIIQSKIRTYFPEQESLRVEWDKLIDYVKFVKQLSENEDPNERERCVTQPKLVDPERVEDLLKNSGKRYKDKNRKGDFRDTLYNKGILAWYDIKHTIVDKKRDVIDLILKAGIPLFNPNRKNPPQIG